MNFPVLHDPDDLEEVPAWCMKVPFIGWCIAYGRQKRNERKLIKQAVARGRVSESAWNSVPHDHKTRIDIEKIVKDYTYGEEATFHPDDPFELMCVLRYGDLNEVEIIMAIENRFDLKISEATSQLWVAEKTSFLEVIRWIEEQKGSSNRVPATD
jgi:hypothetical protein